MGSAIAGGARGWGNLLLYEKGIGPLHAESQFPIPFTRDYAVAFHRLAVRKRYRRALPLKIDVVAAFGALEHDPVCFAHSS
jgi:hypothetical protein